jgi:hypothetical protein
MPIVSWGRVSSLPKWVRKLLSVRWDANQCMLILKGRIAKDAKVSLDDKEIQATTYSGGCKLSLGELLKELSNASKNFVRLVIAIGSRKFDMDLRAKVEMPKHEVKQQYRMSRRLGVAG